MGWSVQYVFRTTFYALAYPELTRWIFCCGSIQPIQIGYALAGSGAVGTVISLALFPWLQRRYNNRKMYTFFASFWSLAFAVMPVGNLAAVLASKMASEKNAEATVWAAIVFVLIPLRIAVNVYP